VTRARVIFRADASHAMGFGHVARLCALIEEVTAQGHEPVALFGGDEAAIKSWARDRKIAVSVGTWSVTQVMQACEHPRVRAIVVDGPSIALSVIPKIPDRVRTILIDDAGKCGLDVATAVNHNIHAPNLAATYPAAKQRLLGRRYLMLRKDIRRYTRGSCRPAGHARLRVVITFGGSDPINATARTLTLLPADRPLELVVIAGPGYRDDETLRAAMAAAVDAGHTVDLRRSPDDPGALFVSADAAICSAGGTLGELAFLGCPALAYAIVRDQVIPARLQVRDGLIAGGSTWCETSDDTLRSEMLSFLCDDAGRAAQRHRALATADADGARRIVDEAFDAL
jgi:spore coat polysaccharide biosynthesis predicted glycosyltransferase SpsG